MLKKVAIGLGALVALILVVLAAAPMFIDAESFKPRVAAAIRDLTGRDLAIAGPVKLRLLPSPVVEAADIRLSNMPGGKAASMIEAKSLRLSVGLFPLLARRLEVSELKLVQPRIALEVTADGRANYDFAPPTPRQSGPADAAAPKAAGEGYRITAERIVVENGTVSLTDARAKREIRLEQIALTASLKGVPAPASLDGTMTANGVRLAIEVRLAAPDGARQPIDAVVKTDGGELRLAGAIEDLAKVPRYAGTLKLSAADFAGFVAGLTRAAGAPPADLPPALARKVAYEGGLEASAAGIVARDFKLSLGDESGSGSLSVTLAPLKIDGKLVFTRLDLDKWLAGTPAPTSTAPAPGAPAAKAGGVPTDLALKLDLRAADVIYGGKSVKDLVLDLELAQGSLALHKLAAVLPGAARLDATSTAQGKAYRGTVSLAGGNLRELLSWLKVDVAATPPGKLGAFSFKGNLGGSGLDTIAITDAAVQLDGTTMKGALTVALKATPSFTLDVQADALDLGAWLPKRAAAAPPGAKGAAPQPASAPADLSGIDARVKAKIARLTYSGERIDGVDADVTLRGGRLTIGDTRISAIAGGSLALKGSVANLGPTPAFDLNIGAQHVNLERLAKLAQQPPFTKSPVGAITVQGVIAGTTNDLTMRNLQVSALGSQLRLTGKLALAKGGPRYDFSAFSLRTDDLGRLFAAAGQEPPGVTGDISATGALQGDPKTVSYRGSFALKGVQAQGSVRVDIAAVPRVTADLRVGDLDIDKLFGGSTAGPAAGASGGGGSRYSRAPIDLSPLKALEGQFKLVAATLQKGVWRLENAQLEATLKGGVLSIARLNGGFYGGSLALTGKIDAARAPGHLDARVTAGNVNLGRFGPALVDSNRIGGTMNANVAFNASLASVHDLVGTLNADGKIHGTVRFNVTDAERVAGRAVGAVGGTVTKGVAGVLRDVTGPLGGVARGAGGAVEGLGLAVRIAMDRFVGRNAPMAGEITVRNGVLSTNNTRVDGERAWAMVVANVNLPAWTQDTTVNVFVQEDPTRPAVVVRQTGSVDHPSRAIATSGAGAPQQQPPPSQPQPQQPAPSTAPQPPKTVPGAVRDLLKGLGR